MTNHLEFSQRKIKKNYRSITGHFPSVKNNRSVGFESKLEKTLFLSLEFDDTVDSYQEQPQIEIVLNGKKKTYSGDCFIKRTKNSNKKDAIVEVKYTGDIEKEKDYYVEKFRAIEETTSKLGLEFIVYTEKTDSEIYISNIDFLYRYKLYPIENKYNDILKRKIGNKKITANDLASSIANSITEYPAISNALWSMLAHKVFRTDMDDSKLTMNSLVELNNGTS